ncbi:hypothetical protein ACFL6I_26855, partial [candidate division KSB1 bacterium]
MQKENSNQIKTKVYSIAFVVTIFSLLSVFSLALLTPPAFAQSVDQLKKEISDFNAKIAELEKEIAQYEAELNVIGSDKQTLQKAIKELDISRRKLLT